MSDFTRIHVGFYSFFIAGLFALIVALLTIGFHALKSAKTNPVDSLRFE